jgi:hypothetical protein
MTLIAFLVDILFTEYVLQVGNQQAADSLSATYAFNLAEERKGLGIVRSDTARLWRYDLTLTFVQVSDHAYSIMELIETPVRKTRLLRLRNP